MSFPRFKKSMVKSLDSYEEKEDEVIKEVSRRKGLWRPTPQAGPLSTLSPTDGGSDPGGGAKPAGGGPICLRGWFPSEDPEQYPHALIPGFPRSSISTTSSSKNSRTPLLSCVLELPSCLLGRPRPGRGGTRAGQHR